MLLKYKYIYVYFFRTHAQRNSLIENIYAAGSDLIYHEIFKFWEYYFQC